MLSAPVLDPARPVYLPRPVNWSHPLNRGRVVWFLALPGRVGGSTWYNLAASAHGAIGNATTSSSGWRPTTRPGGFGHFAFDSSDDQVDVPAFAIPQGTAPRSWAAWFRTSATGLKVLFDQGDTTANGTRFLLYDSGTGKMRLEMTGDTVFGTTTVTDGAWHRVVGTHDGSNASLYIDGLLEGSKFWLMNTPTTVGRFGRSVDNSVSWPGEIDDVTSWARVLTAAEVRADYDLSRRGYPGVLNRY